MALALATLAGVAHAQVPAPPPGPPLLTRPSVPILPGMPSQLTSVPGRRCNATFNARADSDRAADSRPATIQLQLLHYRFGHAMGGHRDRVQL